MFQFGSMRMIVVLFGRVRAHDGIQSVLCDAVTSSELGRVERCASSAEIRLKQERVWQLGTPLWGLHMCEYYPPDWLGPTGLFTWRCER